MVNDTALVMDENTRRYYLDVMGVQCWQSIESQVEAKKQGEGSSVVDSDREVATSDFVTLDENIQQCTQCPLHKTRRQPLTGRGKQSAELMLVVLSPVAGDDESGVICSGEADALLGKMLAAIDIKINDVYLSSLLKCSVPVKHTVLPKEIQACNAFLKRQIQLVQPKLLIVLGETAVRCLLQKDLSIDDYRAMNADFLHGSYEQLASLPLFVSYSPQELLHKPENKRKAWSDLQQLQKIIDNLN